MNANRDLGVRFTIADIFWAVPLVAALAYSYQKVGPSYSLAIAIVVSIALLLFNTMVRHTSKRIYVWLTLSVLVLFCTIPVLQITVTLISLIALCLTIRIAIAQRFEVSSRLLFRLSTVVAAIAVLASCNFVSPGLAQLLRLREEYPIESLAERLEFESKPKHETNRSATLSPVVQSNLAKTNELIASQPHWFLSRYRNLENIHSLQTEQFLRANGFGVGRMGFFRVPHKSIVHWESPGSIGFLDELESSNYRQQVNEDSIKNTFTSLEQTHFLNWFSFLEPASFGWSKEFQTTAGFVPHAFQKSASAFVYKGTTKQLESLQLISLHRFDEPVAYVLNHLPRMDQLSSNNVETRPLNDFEKTALGKLAHQSDIEILEENGRLLMLGSIRATESCLQCHAVEPGELLGAFTYQFK